MNAIFPSPFHRAFLPLLAACLLHHAPSGIAADLSEFEAAEKRSQAIAERLVCATVGLSHAGASGSGVIVSEDGLIMPAAHVLAAAGPDAQWTVVLSDGR